MKKCPVCSNEVQDHVEKCSVCGWIFTQKTSEYNTGNTVPYQSTIKQDDEEETKVQMAPPTAPSPSQHGWGASAPNASVGGAPLNNKPNKPQKKASNNKSMVLVWSLIALCVLAALGVVGYYVLGGSASSGLLKMIPAETDLVVTVDGAQIFKSAGCELSGGKIKIPSELEAFVEQMNPKGKEILEKLLKDSGMDFSQIIYALNLEEGEYGPDFYDAYFLLSLKDKGVAKDYLKIIEKPFEDEKEYKISEIGRNEFVVLDDNYMWLYIGSRHVINADFLGEMTVSDVAKRINTIKEKASKKSVADESYKTKILSGGSAVAAFVDVTEIYSEFDKDVRNLLEVYGMKNMKLGAVMNLDKKSAEVKLTIFDNDGDAVDFGSMQGNIDGSFAKYLMPNDMLVVSCAINPDYDWEKLLDNLEASGMRISDTQRKQILEVYESLGGTMCFALGTDDVKSLMAGDYTKLSGMAMVEFKDDKAEKYLDMASAFANMGGNIDVSKEGSMLKANIAGMTIRLEEKDGNLYLSNRELKEVGNDKMPKSFFEGKCAASILRSEKDNELLKMINMPGGATISFEAKGNELAAKFELDEIGNAQGILEFAILKGVEFAKESISSSRLYENEMSAMDAVPAYGY
ncbi:MAG: DUF4836 family protein [Muribaculaceae bacterium]|nr:DUF4836 family protein [Muribaculaceae bacterium]